jgi:hypothetical protein
MPAVKNADNILGWLARLALPGYFLSRHRIDIFEVQRINILTYLGDAIPEMPEDCAYMQPVELLVHDEVFKSLESQAVDYDAARKAFDRAVAELREHSGLWPGEIKARYGEIVALLDFLDDCLASADLGFMYCWYGEKQEMIRTSFESLARRKDAYHKGYRESQEYIRRTLFSYSAPKHWIERPPV